MKKQLLAAGFLGLLGTTALIGWAPAAKAGNSMVEAQLQSYGDLSMFYQALLNTGVINELNEDGHYTIFAPTNAAFADIRRQNYPCFYEIQCRPQIAALLRDHIIPESHNLADLTSYGYGVRTLGDHPVHIEQAYIGSYTVDGRTILSKSDSSGNVIYRINGVIATPQELAQFQTGSYAPVAYAPDTLTERTVTSYRNAPVVTSYPGGDMTATDPKDNSGTTTTVTHTYITEP